MIDDLTAGVFHEGELLVQERAGEAAIAAHRASGISGEIIPGARGFLAAQRMIAIASVDQDGIPWASLLFGQPGFAATADGKSVALDLAKASIDRSDPLWANLRPGGAVGLLAIELATRRRLRINGRISRSSELAVEIAVRESFPNCPKYIQRRKLSDAPADGTDASMAAGSMFDEPRRKLIERADTLFVASRHPSRGADVSHRGGEPGFARVIDPAIVRVPDYPGNSLFNTLGNFAVAPAAGLAILDFERARLLQIAGQVALHFDVREPADHPAGGTGRYWDLHISRWIERPLPPEFRWQPVEGSAYNPVARRSP